MAEVTASMVKELRDRTGLGMMECKKALVDASGDIELAIDNLRKSGQAKAAKKAGNIAADGAIHIAQGNGVALILEVNSQTDFVAKDDNFSGFAAKVAQLALDHQTSDVAVIGALPYDGALSVEEARVALVQKIGENIQIRRAMLVNGEQIAAYRHGLRIGVIVAFTGDEETGKGIAMHVAAFNPMAINPEDVPADVLAREKEIFIAKAKESGKPDNIIEKMISGSVDKFLNEVTLVRQPYVIDNDKTVQAVLQSTKTTVQSFIRFEVGEGIEKEEVNFADEVAAAVKAAQ